MTLKENSKAYEFVLISIILSTIYSLIVTIISIINNLGLPHTSGANISSVINALTARLPLIVLCILFILAGKSVEKCLKALSLYYILNIAALLLKTAVNFIFWHSIGSLSYLYITILLSALAFIGIWDIKNGGRTGFFKGILLVLVIYEVYSSVSIFVSTAKSLAAFPNFHIIQLTTILNIVFYVVFNIGQYIFTKDIIKINE